MPKIVDEAERKARIAEAVWVIAAKRGLHAATVRAVAAQCDLSVGAIRHSFESQAQLQQYAMALLVEQAKARIDNVAQGDAGKGTEQGTECSESKNAAKNESEAQPGTQAETATGSPTDAAAATPSLVEAIALLLEQLLPLDEERLHEARAWAMFSAEALSDEALRAFASEMGALMERFCRDCLMCLSKSRPRRDDAQLQPEEEAAQLRALLDGLTLRLLTDPTPENDTAARRALRLYLERL